MSLELRPTFTIGVNEPTGVVLRRMRAQLQAPHVQVRWARQPGGGGEATVREDQDHLVLCMAEDVRHFWSSTRSGRFSSVNLPFLQLA